MAMNPLAQLADIQLPEPVTTQPSVLLLLILTMALLLVGVISWLLYQRYQRLAPFRIAEKKLRQLNTEQHDLATQCHRLLKQVALSYQSRQQIAPLTAHAWYQYLDQYRLPSEQGQWPSLSGDPYRPNTPHQGQALHQHVMQQLKAMKKQIKVGLC